MVLRIPAEDLMTKTGGVLQLRHTTVGGRRGRRRQRLLPLPGTRMLSATLFADQ